jgi:hypothetical protein
MIVVLGRYPAYLELGEQLGATVFNVPLAHWRTMSRQQQWEMNRLFLDQAIGNDAIFILASRPPSRADGPSFFRDELDYLGQKGYEVVKEGNMWKLRK